MILIALRLAVIVAVTYYVMWVLPNPLAGPKT
jgi:hypothetical protein